MVFTTLIMPVAPEDDVIRPMYDIPLSNDQYKRHYVQRYISKYPHIIAKILNIFGVNAEFTTMQVYVCIKDNKDICDKLQALSGVTSIPTPSYYNF